MIDFVCGILIGFVGFWTIGSFIVESMDRSELEECGVEI